MFQWGSTISAYDRRRDFEKFASDRNLNVTLDKAPADVQLDFRDWELANKERAARKHIDAAVSAADKSRAITIRYVRPKDLRGAAEDRARIAEAIHRRASE